MTEFVDNDVYKFRLSIYLNEPDIIVYTKPCKPSRNLKNIYRKDYSEMCKTHEKLVQEKYFTKERGEEMFLNRNYHAKVWIHFEREGK